MNIYYVNAQEDSNGNFEIFLNMKITGNSVFDAIEQVKNIFGGDHAFECVQREAAGAEQAGAGGAGDEREEGEATGAEREDEEQESLPEAGEEVESISDVDLTKHFTTTAAVIGPVKTKAITSKYMPEGKKRAGAKDVPAEDRPALVAELKAARDGVTPDEEPKPTSKRRRKT